MSNINNKIIGYFAVHSSQQVLCDGDACVIAGGQSALNRYIKSSHFSCSEYDIRKTRLGEVLEGLLLGGAYAFDQASYDIFSRAANKQGFDFKNQQLPMTEDGNHFIVVRIRE